MDGKNIVGLEMIDYLKNQNKTSDYTDELKKLMEENNFKKFDELFSCSWKLINQISIKG